MTTFLSNREIYTSVVCGIVPQARERLWIVTADIKDMYVPPTHAMRATEARRDMVPFLEVLAGMVKRGIEVRLIHAKDPGPNRRDAPRRTSSTIVELDEVFRCDSITIYDIMLGENRRSYACSKPVHRKNQAVRRP